MENLKPIPNYPGYYASPEGDVYTTRKGGFGWQKQRQVPRKMKLHLSNSNGYYTITAYRDGRRSTVCVHYLVALAFHGVSEAGLVVAHKNGVRTDNKSDNLRWDTPLGNSADMKIHGTSPEGSNNPNARLCEADIRTIRNAMLRGESAQELSARFGVHWRHIHHINERRCWKHVA